MDETRRILITGAGGFVGGHLARHFAAAGWAVTAAGHHRPVPAGPGITAAMADLTDPAAAAALVAAARPAVIVHAAAATTIDACERDPAATARLNVGATASIAAAAPPATRVILLSTDLVFDGESAPYAEDAPPKPLHHYGSQKVQAEAAVLAHAGGIVLRLALTYGPPSPGGAAGFLGWMEAALRAGTPLALFEDEWRTPVGVADIAAAIEVLAGREATGIFHAGGPDRLSRMDMGRLLARRIGADPALLRPARRADAPAGHLRARDVALSTDRLRAMGWTPGRLAGFLNDQHPEA
jgi:dTDP-4-dehydrorhamnose reductase